MLDAVAVVLVGVDAVTVGVAAQPVVLVAMEAMMMGAVAVRSGTSGGIGCSGSCWYWLQ